MVKNTGVNSFVVIDCETTGLGRHDRIVEIAALTLDPKTWEPVDEYDTLINPERDLGPVGLHGITASMVEAAPVFSEVAAALAGPDSSRYLGRAQPPLRFTDAGVRVRTAWGAI